MTDLPAAIAAAREALERYYESEDYGVSPIALRNLLAALDAQELETAKIGAIEAAEQRGFERGLAAGKPDRIWQDRNGALRTSPADCQSFGANGRPIAVYYGSQRFPISQHPLTDEETSHD